MAFMMAIMAMLVRTSEYHSYVEKGLVHVPFLPDSNTISLSVFLTTTFTGSSFVSGISSDFTYGFNFPSCSSETNYCTEWGSWQRSVIKLINWFTPAEEWELEKRISVVQKQRSGEKEWVLHQVILQPVGKLWSFDVQSYRLPAVTCAFNHNCWHLVFLNPKMLLSMNPHAQEWLPFTKLVNFRLGYFQRVETFIFTLLLLLVWNMYL